MFVITNNGKTIFNLSQDISNELSDIKKITEYSPQPIPLQTPAPQTPPQPIPLQAPPLYIPLQTPPQPIPPQTPFQIPIQELPEQESFEPIQDTTNHYTDNKYKLSNNNMNEFENFINTLQPEKKEEKPKINLNLVSNDTKSKSSSISEIKHNIENKTLEKVNNLKVESDLDFDLEEFNNSI